MEENENHLSECSENVDEGDKNELVFVSFMGDEEGK